MTDSLLSTRDRTWIVIALAVCVGGCAPGVDSSQYRPYDQLASDQPAPAVDAPTEDEPDVSVPLSAMEPENATVQASVRPEPVTDASTNAPAITAPSMKVVGNQIVVQKLPGGVRLLVPNHEFRVEGPDGALRVTYDDLDLLRILNMDPVTPDAVDLFPEWLKNLDGKKVRIRGFMGPTFESTGLSQFVIARDLGICCFGPGARIYNLVMVEMRPGKTTDYISQRPIDVVGTFHIRMDVEQGTPLGLYSISDAHVIER